MAVELSKKQKVSLKKPDLAQKQDIVINLNWRRGGQDVDLDLACLYELTDGTRFCVQALGNLFGSLSQPPFIALDQDDRTGDSANGEFLRINAGQVNAIRRVLIYTFIYSGVADWQQAQGVVTVSCPGNEDVIVRMDEYGAAERLCAIALLENNGAGSFSVEKLVRFFPGHPELDAAYQWGLQWEQGKKD